MFFSHRICSDVFVEEPSSTEAPLLCSGTHPNFHQLICDKKKLVWILYLLAKGMVNSMQGFASTRR